MNFLKLVIFILSFASSIAFSQERAGFTDQSLQDILTYSDFHQSAGLMYTWSPRMTLSIRGVSEITSLARELNLDITVLVDPNLPDEETLSATENLWLGHSLKAESKILDRLGITIHYPNLIIYKNGKIDSIRPGYDEPVRVRDYILRRLR